jgi:hypothetical protein
MAEIGIGNVVVKLTGADGTERDLVLKPSLHAVRTLSRKYGGLHPLIDRVAKLDFDVIIDVLEAGAQIVHNPKARQELEAAVYSTGLNDALGGPAILAVKYITILINGGKPPPDDDGAPSEGNPATAY